MEEIDEDVEEEDEGGSEAEEEEVMKALPKRRHSMASAWSQGLLHHHKEERMLGGGVRGLLEGLQAQQSFSGVSRCAFSRQFSCALDRVCSRTLAHSHTHSHSLRKLLRAARH